MPCRSPMEMAGAEIARMDLIPAARLQASKKVFESEPFTGPTYRNQPSMEVRGGDGGAVAAGRGRVGVIHHNKTKMQKLHSEKEARRLLDILSEGHIRQQGGHGVCETMKRKMGLIDLAVKNERVVKPNSAPAAKPRFSIGDIFKSQIERLSHSLVTYM
ncbi:hypothetical protein L2E82_50295 [Cichorium intybus]|nr:hypothetical protein L2E82_50295 [Cichorium intybus]